MSSIILWVVRYSPPFENYFHWALYVDDANNPIIFQVVGGHPFFKSEVVKTRPERSSHYVDRIFVGYIRQGDVNIISAKASRAFVDNDTVEWDCQDYVLDLLDILEEQFIVDPEDEEYQYVRDELLDKRGGNI
jgi:hypothetical protein